MDIEAIKEIDGRKYRTAIQCKRYVNIAKRDIEELVEKVKNAGSPPHQLLLILSCDFSKKHHDYLRELATTAGIVDVKIWTASTIEAMLYKDFKDLLFVYFGVRIEQKQRDNAAAVRYANRMEKKMTKDFLRKGWFTENPNRMQALCDSTMKFITSRAIIRSIDDTEYPTVSDTSQWYREHLYDFYHNGLEIWISAASGHYAIIDEQGMWEPVPYHDERLKSPRYNSVRVKVIGRIRYTDIVDYKIDGDNYYNEPHIYCRFNDNNEPYEEIYYKTGGNPEKSIPDWELPKEKRTSFPKG